MTNEIYVRINDDYPLGYHGLFGSVDSMDKRLRGQRGVLKGLSNSGLYLKVLLDSGEEYLFRKEELDFIKKED